MRKPKETAVWTVRNHLNQYLGSFRAFTAEQAISKAVAADRATASTFRKSQPASLNVSGLTAKVES